MIEKDLAAAESDYRALTDKEIPAFNKANAARGIAIKTAPKA
jgi:hypothetical protein